MHYFLDPFETLNRASSLTNEEKSYMHDALEKLKNCRGRSCTLKRHHPIIAAQAQDQISRPNKRKHGKH